MENNDCVISSKNLTCEPYIQLRGEGFSGQLMMATDINNPNVRYIIKAGQAHVAACEFMFYRLALKLGLCTARVWLVEVAKVGEFMYPACAVDYIPNATKLPYAEWKDIEECRILTDLSFMLGDRDNMDFLRDENGVIYKIDHSDCFGIESTAETWINPNKINLSYLFVRVQILHPLPTAKAL